MQRKRAVIHLFSALIPRQSILDATQPIWAVELSHVTQIGRVEADAQVFLGDLTYPTKELCAVLRLRFTRYSTQVGFTFDYPSSLVVIRRER
jgi:hypothetical protein